MDLPCTSIESDKLISRGHNGRCFEVENPSQLQVGVIEVDGCLITDASRRVDWGVALPESKKLKDGVRAIKLIELKGSNLERAFSQMHATMQHPSLRQVHSLIDECFIVCQVKPIFSTLVQREKLTFTDQHKIPIKVVAKALISASLEDDS